MFCDLAIHVFWCLRCLLGQQALLLILIALAVNHTIVCTNDWSIILLCNTAADVVRTRVVCAVCAIG